MRINHNQRILLISVLQANANRDPDTIGIVRIMSYYICVLIIQWHYTYTVLTDVHIHN